MDSQSIRHPLTAIRNGFSRAGLAAMGTGVPQKRHAARARVVDSWAFCPMSIRKRLFITARPLEIRGAAYALHAHGQLVPETPHLVAPAAWHLADGQPREVCMLLPQQVANQFCGDLDLGAGHKKSQF